MKKALKALKWGCLGLQDADVMVKRKEALYKKSSNIPTCTRMRNSAMHMDMLCTTHPGTRSVAVQHLLAQGCLLN